MTQSIEFSKFWSFIFSWVNFPNTWQLPNVCRTSSPDSGGLCQANTKSGFFVLCVNIIKIAGIAARLYQRLSGPAMLTPGAQIQPLAR